MNLRSFTLRRGAAILTLSLALVLAACGSSGTSNEGGGTVAVVNGAVTVTAAELEFDASTIEATAGEAFTITFDNADSVPHNISVYTEEGGEVIIEGEIIDGGETVAVEVPALEAGTYYFMCDLHPDMNGAVVVSASGS
jgi:plastocyanin